MSLETLSTDIKSDPAKAVELLANSAKDAATAPYFLQALDALLQFVVDKKCTPELKTKLITAMETLCKSDSVSEHAIKRLGIPVAMRRAEESTKWVEKVTALRLIELWAESAPDAVTDSMVIIVPKLSALVWDSKKEVSSQAKATLTAACKAIDNVDLVPFIPQLILAVSNPETVEDCIYGLAATTFVQAVKAPALSITVPLLERGFRERKIATVRQCAKITENLAKLVADPVDVAPFMPVLGPALEKSKNDVSDPECRSRCAAAHDALLAIGATEADSTKAKQAEEAALQTKIKDLVAKALKGSPAALIVFAENACLGLINDKEKPNLASWLEDLTPTLGTKNAKGIEELFEALAGSKSGKAEPQEIIEDDAKEGEDVLCDCRFSLAYGSKILLNSARMKLLRGHRYGLIASKAAGKTTLLKAIANNQLEGFPGPEQCKTVFVEDDIAGSDSKLGVVGFVLKTVGEEGVTEEMVRKGLANVGFDDHHLNLPVSSLSGGWRIKTAVARAMLRNADILLLDQPTNHLDVKNIAWVTEWLQNQKDVTSLIVTHDVAFGNAVLTNCIFFTPSLKLDSYVGNLEAFFQKNPDARKFFQIEDSDEPFNFPTPAPIEGLKAKGSKCMTMENVSFTYPGAPRPQLENVNVRVSMASRVCCAGANGAGKSTLIKLLTGALTPTVGTVWRHPNVRVAYVGQHAFEYIEAHLAKTPNEYIRWRYDGGDDKEALNKSNMQITPEEQAIMDKPMEVSFVDDEGKTQREKRVIERLMGRRKEKTGLFYECKFKGKTQDQNIWMDRDELIEKGFEKMCMAVDRKKLAAEGAYVRTLSARNVEEHLIGVGLDSEAATHTRISQLSSGQKIKVVLAAALWYLPHILILDEPTNYASREDQAALAKAMNNWQGGIVLITHSKAFAELTTRENWVVQDYKCIISGEADWTALEKEALELGIGQGDMLDAAGNKVEQKKKNDPDSVKPRDKKVMMKEIKKKINDGAELTEFEYACATAWGLWN